MFIVVNFCYYSLVKLLLLRAVFAELMFDSLSYAILPVYYDLSDCTASVILDSSLSEGVPH